MNAQNVYSIALDLAKADSSIAIPAFQETQTLEWINWLRDQFFTETELLRITAKATTPASTTISANYTGGSTMSLTSATDFNGAFIINDERGLHTGVSTLDLTGVSNVYGDYDSGTQIIPLFKMPDMISLQNFEISGAKYEPFFIETERGKFFDYPTAEANITFSYSYLPITLTDLNDELNIANPYHYYIVYGLLRIWKEVMESTQDTSLETARMSYIVNQAVGKRMQSRKLKLTSFARYRS